MTDRSNSEAGVVHELRQSAETVTRLRQRLRDADGGGTSGGMETRVNRLEGHVEVMQRDIAELKTDMRTLIDIVRGLPTKSDLTTFRWQWVATSVAAIALIVGGIIGGLGWIKPDAPASTIAAPPPIVIQVPTTPVPGSDAVKPTH